MTAIKDDRGFNQVFEQSEVNLIRLGRRAAWIMEQMNVKPGNRVLEIGCGTGYMAYTIAKTTGMQVLGSDLCKPFIEAAKQTYPLHNLSFEAIDFKTAVSSIESKFEYITGNGILHHLYPELDEALVAMRKLLNDGGKIIFMEPNIYNPYVAAIFKVGFLRKWASLEPDEMAFSKSFIAGKLRAAGFSDISIAYRDFLLPGTPKFMVKPSIAIGNVLEKTPLKIVSQSILISAKMT